MQINIQYMTYYFSHLYASKWDTDKQSDFIYLTHIAQQSTW